MMWLEITSNPQREGCGVINRRVALQTMAPSCRTGVEQTVEPTEPSDALASTVSKVYDQELVDAVKIPITIWFRGRRWLEKARVFG